MKVAVYSIALNEAQFVERWASSAKDADLLLIADTGSTDNTAELARSLGIACVPISVQPWRFDDARNASLALIPPDIDYCIALDLDEVLADGWRDELERAHSQGITRPRYTYVWSWDADNKPDLVFGGDKIHARHGYRWVHPAHEVLMPDRIPEQQGWVDVQIHHHPDPTKSRSHYLELLALGAWERPHDPRDAYYYARELVFAQHLSEARTEFERFLALPDATWAPQRAEAMRYIALCTEETERERWLRRSIEQAPDLREGYVALATHFYEIENWAGCLENAECALAITEKSLEYATEARSWGWYPHDLAAIAAHNLGLPDKALRYGLEALALNPGDSRLEENIKHYEFRA